MILNIVSKFDSFGSYVFDFVKSVKSRRIFGEPLDIEIFMRLLILASKKRAAHFMEFGKFDTLWQTFRRTFFQNLRTF